MKKCIEILEFEDKETQAGKKYVRFRTSEGWMSCFDSKSNEELKKRSGEKAVNCEITESGEFKNIKKFLGDASETPQIEIETPGPVKTNGKKEMYVSYVKDIFCQFVGRISQKEFDDKIGTEEIEKLMNVAIRVIKKAEKSF